MLSPTIDKSVAESDNIASEILLRLAVLDRVTTLLEGRGLVNVEEFSKTFNQIYNLIKNEPNTTSTSPSYRTT